MIAIAESSLYGFFNFICPDGRQARQHNPFQERADLVKLKNPLLAVRDMERSKTFYREVLGLHVVMDFGANVTLTGGLCLQTLDTWTDFLGKEVEEIRFGANDSEVYFEEDDFDGFLASCDTIVMGRKAYEDCLSSLPEAAEAGGAAL